MSGQYRQSNVHIISANATDTRYVVPNTLGDPRPDVRVRTNDPLARDITGEVSVTYPSARAIAIAFPQPPGNHTFIIGLTAHHH